MSDCRKRGSIRVFVFFAEQRRLAVATTTVETGKKMLKLKQ
jgi:hypothetical protein